MGVVVVVVLVKCKNSLGLIWHSFVIDRDKYQWCIGGYTRVYAVYQPLGFFDSVYSPQ